MHTCLLPANRQVVTEGPDVGCEAHTPGCQHVSSSDKADAAVFHGWFNTQIPWPLVFFRRLSEFDELATPVHKSAKWNCDVRQRRPITGHIGLQNS